MSTVLRKTLGQDDPPIPERDWDNLLLLDACRYDLFEELNSLPGELDSYYSVASNTAEYVQKTFNGTEFPDIVCVTSTPKYYKPNVEDSFHDIIHVWREDWNAELGTIPAETMNKHVLQAIDEYPSKRILAHYIPPHQPFIGPTGQEIPHEVRFSGDVIAQDTDAPNLWESIRNGDVKPDRVRKAYRENLKLTLPAIEEILDELPGKTVITSDHGNVFGSLSEWGVVGHPPYRHIEPLIKVPWLVHSNGDRRDIHEGSIGTDSSDINDELVKERLGDLGYLE